MVLLLRADVVLLRQHAQHLILCQPEVHAREKNALDGKGCKLAIQKADAAKICFGGINQAAHTVSE